MGMIDAFKGFFKKKRTIRAHFYDEARRKTTRTIKYDNNCLEVKFNGAMHTYIVDEGRVTYDAKSNMPEISYYIGNPRPIIYQHERNEEMDSVGFKHVIDSKVIKDLFSDEDKTKMMLLIVLICVTLGATIITMAKVFGWIK